MELFSSFVPQHSLRGNSMFSKKKFRSTSVGILAVIFSAAISFYSCKNSSQTTTQKKIPQDSSQAGDESSLLKEYAHSELKTDFSRHSIPLDSIRDGGVGKNDIPAIDFPEFMNVPQARSFLSEPDFGIL